MVAGDVPAAVRAWRDADIDMRRRVGLPEIVWDDREIARSEVRAFHFLRTDPEGSWVVEVDGVVSGLAQAHRREGLWVLAHLFVAPPAQGCGAGHELIDRTLEYGSRDEPGLIISSLDPRAMRRYAVAGFALHPAVVAWGRVRPERLSPPPDVRSGDGADLELAAAVDRRLRGAARTADLALCLEEGDRMLVVPERGFALLRETRVVPVVALDEDVARQLLTAGLLEAAKQGRAPAEVARMTAAQGWAMEVALAAGLELHPHGPIFVRGRPGPLAPYLPDGALG